VLVPGTVAGEMDGDAQLAGLEEEAGLFDGEWVGRLNSMLSSLTLSFASSYRISSSIVYMRCC